jgi:hypothetical protein
MDSEIKKATNISRIRRPDNGERSLHDVDELFSEPWDELVIRFDETSHQFTVQKVVQPEDLEKIAVRGGR